MQYWNPEGKFILRSPDERHQIEVEFWFGCIANNTYVTFKLDGKDIDGIPCSARHFILNESETDIRDELQGAS